MRQTGIDHRIHFSLVLDTVQAEEREFCTRWRAQVNRFSMTRRDFVRLSAGVVAAGAVTGRLAAKPLRTPIGLQLFSVRKLLPEDFDGTLRKVSAAGYTEVEAAGY